MKYGDVFGATTAQFSSLMQLVHPYELLASSGIYFITSTPFLKHEGFFEYGFVIFPSSKCYNLVDVMSHLSSVTTHFCGYSPLYIHQKTTVGTYSCSKL